MNKILKIFIASPANLEEERNSIKKVAERINATVGNRINIFLQVLSWEHNIYPNVGDDAQDVINSQINDEYDIFVGLMWDRVGSETKREVSGTIEEYERAYTKYLLDKKTCMMMYFKAAPICIDNIDVEQIEKLRNFKKHIVDNGNLYYNYSSLYEFSEMFYDHLVMVIMDYKKTQNNIKFAKDYIINNKNNTNIEKQSTALALMYKNNILIVKRSKELRVGAGLWQLPGGKMNYGESPLEAMTREITEELGLKLNLFEFKKITTVNSKSLGDSNNTLIKLHLFFYEIKDKNLNFILDNSIDAIKWLPISDIYRKEYDYLGDTLTLLKIAKRYKYAYLPLRSIQEYTSFPYSVRFPKKFIDLSEETTQVLMSTLDVLGFVDESTLENNIKEETKALFSVLLEWCLTSRSVFEPDGFSDWQTNMLLLNSGDRLLEYQKTLFERHESLSSLMSYKLSKVLSHRDVCDLLIFVKINNKIYVLLRWDFFADKYQIPSKGLENCLEKEYDDKIAKFVIGERLSNDIVSSFSYQYLGRFCTTHLSSGSLESIRFVRDYEIYLFLLQIKNDEIVKVLNTIETINQRASFIMDSSNISKETKKDTVSFHWVELEKLMIERYTYKDKKVQGFSEIVDFIGEDRFIQLATKYATDLSMYKKIINKA